MKLDLQMYLPKTLLASLLFFLQFSSANIHAETTPFAASIITSSDTEISYTVYPAKGQQLLLWFYSEAGPQKNDRKLAEELSKLGVEVWLIDLFDSYFLPVALSSMDKIPASDISEFIRISTKKSAKQVFPVGTGRAAIPLLRGARQLQLDEPDNTELSPLVLISPKFYTETPDPGTEAELMPIVSHTNQLLFIIQPDKSPWFWKLNTTMPALESSGSDIFLQPVKGVRDRFYFRPDADEFEKKMTAQLPDMLASAITYLQKFPAKQRTASVKKLTPPAAINTKKEKSLRPHKGNSQPPELVLANMQNQIIDLKDLKDKVILINFWASWCPPCVHEMPSMQRLQDKYSTDDFLILGVNMAEEKPVIENFLQNKVSVSFPVLLDSDGAALQRWKVFAFPTSYLVDKKGQIRYSLFGSIEWDNNETVKIIDRLTKE